MPRGRGRAPASDASRAAPDDGDGLSQDDERDALEGIGGSGSRAGSDGDVEGDSGLSDDEERDTLEGVGGSGSRAGGGDSDRVRDDDGTRDADSGSGGGSSGRDPRGSTGQDRTPEPPELDPPAPDRKAGTSDLPSSNPARSLVEQEEFNRGARFEETVQRANTATPRGLLEQTAFNQNRARREALAGETDAAESLADQTRASQPPNIAGGDARLFNEVRRQAREQQQDGVDFSTAFEDPVGFLRGAGPQREERFVSDVTGGVSDVGADLEDEFRARVTPGPDPITQQDVARGSQAFINEQRDELSSAALAGVAAPEPTSSAAGAVTLGLLGVAAAAERGEIETPEERPGVFREFETPDEPGSIESELGIGQQRPEELSIDEALGGGVQSELDRPDDFVDRPDPTIVSFDRLIQRGRARQREREREDDINPFRRDDRGADREELDEILSGGGTLGEVEEEATDPERDVFDDGEQDFVGRRDTGPGDVTAGEVGGGLDQATSAEDVFADDGASFAQRSAEVGDALFDARGGLDDVFGGAADRRDAATQAAAGVDLVQTPELSPDVESGLDDFLGTRTTQTPRSETTPRQQTRPRLDDLLTPETASPDLFADPTGAPTLFEDPPRFNDPTATSTPAQPPDVPSRPPRLSDDDDPRRRESEFDDILGVRDVEAELDTELEDEFGSVGEGVFDGL